MKFYNFFVFLFSFVSCVATAQTQENGHDVIFGENGETYHTGLLHTLKDDTFEKTYMKLDLEACKDLPKDFDLRDLGYVSDVRNQGSCGSCWTFSMVGSLESALRMKGKGQFDLAEQDVLSCDKTNYGCSGGNLHGFSYLIGKGAALEKDYPYTASNSRCKTRSKAAKGVSFEYVGGPNRSPTLDELKCALWTSKTVPWITVSATNAWGSVPKSEKQEYTRCRNGQTNHAVGVTGWHDGNVLHMKNSWGKSWGADGYMSMKLGCDSFGDEVAFIKVGD